MLGLLKYTKFHKMSSCGVTAMATLVHVGLVVEQRDKAPPAIQQPACSADMEYKQLSV